MLVKIRLQRGPSVRYRPGGRRRLALALAALLAPGTFLAAVLALWRLAADMDGTADFAIRTGPLSHWQVWLGITVVLGLAAHLLNRYGRNQRSPEPSSLPDRLLVDRQTGRAPGRENS